MDDIPGIIARYLRAYEAKDIEALLDTLTDDVTFEHQEAGRITAEAQGRSAFRTLATVGASIFVERRQHVLNCIALGDHIILRIRFEGLTSDAPPGGLAPRTQVAIDGLSLFELREGRIRRLVDVSAG